MPATPDTKTYSLGALANALLAAHQYGQGAGGYRDQADDARRTYYLARGAAFRRAFGMSVKGDPTTASRNHPLDSLLDNTIRSMFSFSSPTSSYLEAPRVLVEFAERFRPAISRASQELDNVLHTMLLALLAELVTPGTTTVTGDDLRKHGFDPDAAPPEEPDPLDFF